MIYFGNDSIRKHAGSLFKISAILAILVLLSYLRTVCEAHTILLVQPNHKAETRTYSDYESLNECLEGICKIFEEHLKRCHPDQPSITYDISQLFDFIDKLKDLCCLVYQKNIKLYCPHSKEWLKEKIYIMLRKQAGKA